MMNSSVVLVLACLIVLGVATMHAPRGCSSLVMAHSQEAFRSQQSIGRNHYRHSLAFAARPAGGGFGAGGSSSTAAVNKGKSKKKKKNTSSTKQNSPATSIVDPSPSSSSSSFFTPEGRMAHIQNRIQAADISSMAVPVQGGVSGEVEINPNAICIVDNFLGAEFVASMRREAESLLPTMIPSQSTRWDEATQTVVPYVKHRVLSMQVEGGAEGYAASPRLVEYVVTLTSHLTAKLNQILPDKRYHLATDKQTNKLAVCLGDGSKYDKHIDNMGGSDRRKLTALLYLQPPDWYPDDEASTKQVTTFADTESAIDPIRGGYFRAYDVPSQDQVTCIAPKGDRLLLFWSDSLVHDVSPSNAPNGKADQRWALTVWFVVNETTGVIRATTAEMANRHWKQL